MRRSRAPKKNAKQGPKLPYLLSQELDTAQSNANQVQKKGVSMYHVTNRRDARKAARKAKKVRNANAQSKHAPPTGILAQAEKTRDQNLQTEGPVRKKRRMDPVPLIKQQAGSESEDDSEQKFGSDSDAEVQPPKAEPTAKKNRARKTHFNKLLDADVLKGTDEKAMTAELELQRKLAKKLGIKKQAAHPEPASVKVNDIFKEDLQMDSDSEDDGEEAQSESEDDVSNSGREEQDLEDVFLGRDSDAEGDTNPSMTDRRLQSESYQEGDATGLFSDDSESEDDQDESDKEDSDGEESNEEEPPKQSGRIPKSVVSKSGSERKQEAAVYTEDTDEEMESDSEEDGMSSDEDDDDDDDDDDNDNDDDQSTESIDEQPLQSTGKYIPPGARLRAAQATADKSMAHDALRKRMTGLLNKLSDPNLPGVAAEVLTLFNIESRRSVMDIACDLLLQAVVDGPRASERFTAVTAAFVSGIAARGDCIEFAANFTAHLALALEESLKRSDTLAASNLGTLMSHLYMTGLVSAGCLFSLLEALRESFQEQDVALIHLILKACGLKLRSEDPVAMKEFVVGIHATAAERKATMTQRAEIMLELVVDIKNNRKSGSAAPSASLEAYLCQGTLRWLKDSKVEDVQLKGLTWQRLLASNKKGLWWQSQAGELAEMSGMSKLLKDQNQQYGSELLQLAAKQRMNTDVRRAIFCIVMGSEDFVDASERLLKLPLKGESQREIVRVIMECCMQEKDWNPYYAALLRNLLKASQSHTVTTQFCAWDHFKTLKTQTPRRAMNLARLMATLVTSAALPFSALRAANLYSLAHPVERQFWQTFFSRVLLDAGSPEKLQALLKSLAQPHLQKFAASIAAYLQEDFSLDSLARSSAGKVNELRIVAQKTLLSFQRSV